MSIPDEDIARVRAATDMVKLVGEHAALRQVGRRWSGLCPFHSEKTPSFSVNAEEGFYYCFGCQASGDAISFVRAMEHLDFADAVRWLADRAGITIHEDMGGGADRQRRDVLFDAMERAVTWYHERLLSAPDAGAARHYLRGRGYDGQIVRTFRLGWAPDDWDAFGAASGLSQRVLTDSGLGFVNRRGRTQDAFRGRVIFPICDPSGRPVAIGARVLPQPPAGARGDMSGGPERRPEPKYKNSTETAIYSKRRTLYGLNWAKQEIVTRGSVVVCEGYTDVIGLHQAGIHRAVATCGTALAEEHFRLLRNFARRIVLAYDADSAGQSATSRVYEWERKHEVDVAVVTLPQGADPGELARTDPDGLRREVEAARPFLQFRVERALDSADLGTVEGRAHGAEAALRAIAEHPDPLVRDQYVMPLADRCRMDPALLRARIDELRRHPPTTEEPRSRRSGSAGSSGPASSVGPDRSTGPTELAGPTARGLRRHGGGAGSRSRPADLPARSELEALRFMVHDRGLVDGVLDEVLFADDLRRRTFAALTGGAPLSEVVAGSDEDVAELLRRLSVEEPAIDQSPAAVVAQSVIVQLVRLSVQRAIGDELAGARAAGRDVTAQAAIQPILRWQDELDVDDYEACREPVERLLAWLRGRPGEAIRPGNG